MSYLGKSCGQYVFVAGKTCTYIQNRTDHSMNLFVNCVLLRLFLGAFAKLRKATVNFVVSVCTSAWNYSAPTGRILSKLDI